jgi:hypothetical protein
MWNEEISLRPGIVSCIVLKKYCAMEYSGVDGLVRGILRPWKDGGLEADHRRPLRAMGVFATPMKPSFSDSFMLA